MIQRSLIPAVVYIRMSTDQQDGSPDQQRAEVAKLAERHGHKLIEEYFDAGISGDEIEKRPAFQKMLADAEAGKFKTIFCWDQDRFGRFTIWKAGEVISPLIDAGVTLVTVAQGMIDWNKDADTLVYAVNQVQKHTFLRDLSRNVLRGQLANLDTGSWLKSAPIGMCRVYSDESGTEQKRVEYDEELRKPKGWIGTLAVSEVRTAEVEAMQWAFHEYADTDSGLYTLAQGLAERGIRSRAGTCITPTALRDLLTNPKYSVRLELGRFRKGKFHSVNNDGEICAADAVPVDGARKRREPTGLLKIRTNLSSTWRRSIEYSGNSNVEGMAGRDNGQTHGC